MACPAQRGEHAPAPFAGALPPSAPGAPPFTGRLADASEVVAGPGDLLF